MKEPVFKETLKSNIDYYGFTEEAYEFAAEEHARQMIIYSAKTANRPKMRQYNSSGPMWLGYLTGAIFLTAVLEPIIFLVYLFYWS